jgi:type IV secretion system protein VirD4
VSDQLRARYNPLNRPDPASLDLAENANTLADALVHDAPGQSGEAHWNEEAKALIAGLILHTVFHEPTDRRVLADMQNSAGAGGLIARAADRQLGKSDREAAGVLSSAQRHTQFLDRPCIAASTAASDFSFAGLKDKTLPCSCACRPTRSILKPARCGCW